MIDDLEELVKLNIINEDSASKIRQYYKNKGSANSNHLLYTFGVIGATLIGLGLILIIAHNWDELSNSTKTIFAFLPMVLGQVACGFLLWKNRNSAWSEACSAFLFFAVAVCISLISQIYNIPGDWKGFVLVWMLLTVPIVYIMQSSLVALFYIVGITSYSLGTEGVISYWALLAIIFPYYWYMHLTKPDNNSTQFLHWFMALSIPIGVSNYTRGLNSFNYLLFASLFSVFILGGYRFLKSKSVLGNPYSLIGSMGLVVTFIVLSFRDMWESFYFAYTSVPYTCVAITILCLAMLYFRYKEVGLKKLNPFEYVIIPFIIILIVGSFIPVISNILINILILALGVLVLRNGLNNYNLKESNYGLMIITILIACRFFDSNISILLRGIIFLVIGVAFIFTNYFVIKLRDKQQKLLENE